MTDKQYDRLCIGDFVTRTGGPNKGIVLRVTKKYLGGGGTPCLAAVPVNEDEKVYIQNTCRRGSNIVCGSARCYKLLQKI